MSGKGWGMKWKRVLLDSATPKLEGEQPRAIALAQPGAPYWVLFSPAIVGMVLTTGLLRDDSIYPTWLSIVGIAIAVAGIVFVTMWPTRFLVRTDGILFVFDVPWAWRNRNRRTGELLGRHPAGELDSALARPPLRIGGERLYPMMSQRSEREGMLAAGSRSLPAGAGTAPPPETGSGG